MKNYLFLFIAFFFFDSFFTSATSKRAGLLIIDVQNCFVEGGTLAVDGGLSVVPIINKIIENYKEKFHTIVYTLDSHPPNHVSFISQYINQTVFKPIHLFYNYRDELCNTSVPKLNFEAIPCGENYKILSQILWPDHCVQDTNDSNIVSSLKTFPPSDNILYMKKGQRMNIDAYSPFFDNNRLFKSDLDGLLKQRSLEKLFFVGIATDYCVKTSVLDAKDLGYDTYLILEATKGVNKNTTEEAIDLMIKMGVHVIKMEDLDKYF